MGYVRRTLIHLCGGRTSEAATSYQKEIARLQERVADLELYKKASFEALRYLGNPAWKAQQEYRQGLYDAGLPLTGKYPSGANSYPTHLENVDDYLGQLVDFYELHHGIDAHSSGYRETLSYRGSDYLVDPGTSAKHQLNRKKE